MRGVAAAISLSVFLPSVARADEPPSGVSERQTVVTVAGTFVVTGGSLLLGYGAWRWLRRSIEAGGRPRVDVGTIVIGSGSSQRPLTVRILPLDTLVKWVPPTDRAMALLVPVIGGTW